MKQQQGTHWHAIENGRAAAFHEMERGTSICQVHGHGAISVADSYKTITAGQS